LAVAEPEYDDWRNAVHSQMPRTDPILLGEIVKRTAGERVVRWQRIVGGEMNEVYAAHLESDGELIVRVSRRIDCRFAGERWALAAAADAGVPVPTVLSLSNAEDDHGALQVCVEARLAGVGMDTLAYAQRQPLIEQAGELLARLHSIPVAGFGYVHPDGSGPLSSWSASLRSEQTEAELVRTESHAANLGIPASWVRAASTELHGHDALLRGVAARLIHGDFNLAHLLTDGETITGIVDFEDAAGADPAAEFNWWNYFRPEAPIEWLLTGYRRDADVGDQFDLRLRLARLRLDLGLADHFGKIGHPMGQAVHDRFAEDAAWFAFGR